MPHFTDDRIETLRVLPLIFTLRFLPEIVEFVVSIALLMFGLPGCSRLLGTLNSSEALDVVPPTLRSWKSALIAWFTAIGHFVGGLAVLPPSSLMAKPLPVL